MDLPVGAGGLVEFKAALLASHGFVTLKLAYLAYDDLPEFPPSIKKFEEAANWVSNHPKVLPHGICIHAITMRQVIDHGLLCGWQAFT